MKKIAFLIIEVVLLALIVAVSVYNAMHDDGFWNFSFPQALTLFVAIVFAFSASQFRTDERKLKEQAEKMVLKIQQIVNTTSFFSISGNGEREDTKKQNRMACRKLSNCIVVLKEYANKLNIGDEVEYIYNQYKEYNDFISDHLDDLDYLGKSESTLKKYADNIDSKCDQLVLKLFK